MEQQQQQHQEGEGGEIEWASVRSAVRAEDEVDDGLCGNSFE